MFAQVIQQAQEGMTPTTIIGAFIFGWLSLLALIGWILKHLFLTTIPRIHDEAAKQRESSEKRLNEVCETFKVDSTSVCGTFKAESLAERTLCAQKFDVLNASLIALTSVLGQGQQTVIAAINQHTTEAMGAYRHEMANEINKAVLGKELYLEQQARMEREKKA